MQATQYVLGRNKCKLQNETKAHFPALLSNAALRDGILSSSKSTGSFLSALLQFNDVKNDTMISRRYSKHVSKDLVS